MTDAKRQETASEVIARDWNSIDWCKNARIVRNLRQRIFRASRQGDYRKVRSLQRLMLKCTANQETSIRKVTQINNGRSTPGVDKVIVKTPAARSALMREIATYKPQNAQPVRRVYIPKANGKKRPLGIPTIRDRVMQAIVKNALEPEWEAKFEPCSYGFRPGRSSHDAISRLYQTLRPTLNKHWVVDADITGFFDNSQHDTILDAIQGFPGQKLIRAWLKAGIMENQQWSETEAGTPQGGIISPLLANIALHGMEAALGIKYTRNRDSYRNRGNRTLVRYADDFVICTRTKEDAEQAQAEISDWLQQRGLELSKEKTHIRHIQEGFNFLGFNLRQYPVTNRAGWKLLIKPSKEAVEDYKNRLRQEWQKLIGQNVGAVVKKLRPIITGWGNYYRTVVSKETFSSLDDFIFHRIYRWCKRTHPRKGFGWIRKTYFGKRQAGRQDNWVFGGEKGYLPKLKWIPIKRHILVKHDASPDNPSLQAYWEWRDKKKAELLPSYRQRELAKRQKGRCSHCRESLHNEEELHVHHIIRKPDGGTDALSNLALIHLYCHQQIHSGAITTSLSRVR